MTKRNKQTGRYERELLLYKLFFLGTLTIFAVGLSFIGVNQIAERLNKLFMVENSHAEEVKYDWQDEVKLILINNGIDVVKASKIIDCESKWNPDAINYNYDSIDYGIWQINSKAHSEITRACSTDPICATKMAVRIIKKTGFKEWVCNRYVH